MNTEQREAEMKTALKHYEPTLELIEDVYIRSAMRHSIKNVYREGHMNGRVEGSNFKGEEKV